MVILVHFVSLEATFCLLLDFLLMLHLLISSFIESDDAKHHFLALDARAGSRFFRSKKRNLVFYVESTLDSIPILRSA